MQIHSEDFYINFTVPGQPYKDENGKYWSAKKILCFRHAVLRASQGEDIDVEVNDYDHRCEDCIEKRP